jgi:hypothetical protein
MSEPNANRAELAHMVYFTLNDDSQDACEQLVAACHKYLKNHSGVSYFRAGTRVESLQRPVNDQTFHVSLHVVFDNKDSHDTYQTHPDHVQFIEENKANWKQVRVFDSFVE